MFNDASDNHSKSSSSNITINSGRMLLKCAYQQIYDLRRIIQDPNVIEGISTSDKVMSIKNQLKHKMELIRRGEQSLKQKVTIRQRKREKLKIKRKTIRDEKERNCAEAHKRIDDNLERIRRREIEKKQTEEDIRKIKSQIKEIDRKRKYASKYLSSLASLTFLRIQRKSYSNIDENPAIESDFLKKISNLSSLWKSHILRLDKERALLTGLLIIRNNDEIMLKEKMFGDKHFDDDPLSRISLDELVDVRRSWDQFLAEDGSYIPTAWICPIENNTVTYS